MQKPSSKPRADQDARLELVWYCSNALQRVAGQPKFKDDRIHELSYRLVLWALDGSALLGEDTAQGWHSYKRN